MPSIFNFDGITGYVYDERGGQHSEAHFHVYYAEYAIEIYMNGKIKEGSLLKAQLRKVLQWLKTGGKKKAIKKWRELNED